MDWDSANKSWYSADTIATALGAGTSSFVSGGLNSVFSADGNGVTLNKKVFNVSGLEALAGVAGNAAGAGIEYAIGGKTTINLLNTSMFGLKDVYGNTSRTGLLEMTFDKENGVTSRIGTGGYDLNVGNLVQAAGGLHDAVKISDAKLSALTGKAEKLSTMNALNLLGYTSSDLNLKIASDIWNDQTAVEYKDMKNEYGEYSHSSNTITLSSALLGGGLEESARLTAVLRHEGSHANGVNVEGLAHTNGLLTYAETVQNFGLTGDADFAGQMLSGIMDVNSWSENSGDVEYWRVVSDKTGKITQVLDDGDNSLITLVDEEGNIKSITQSNGKSLTEQIAALSKTGQSKNDINSIMVDSNLDYDKNKGWYAKISEGQYKVGQNVPAAQDVFRNVHFDLSESNEITGIRDTTVFQEEIEKELGLPLHSACAIASTMMETDTFLLANYGIGAKDSAQMIEILKNYGTSAFITSGKEAGTVTNMTALSAFYAQGLGMDDYLIFNDEYTSDKPTSYYLEKAIKLNDFGEEIPNKTHFMTNTLFGHYDPDSTTNNRWWTNIDTYKLKYKAAIPKSSKVKK